MKRKMSYRVPKNIDGYWHTYNSDGTRRQASSRIKMMDKIRQIVYSDRMYVGVVVKSVKMTNGVITGKYKDVQVTYNDLSGVWHTTERYLP